MPLPLVVLHPGARLSSKPGLRHRIYLLERRAFQAGVDREERLNVAFAAESAGALA